MGEIRRTKKVIGRKLSLATETGGLEQSVNDLFYLEEKLYHSTELRLAVIFLEINVVILM